ncbi:hypothetical protein M141_1134 [Bacteroides fragilis str. S38L5]|nr:hypothetical protein M141_1134 [Bacteroides fragilis str. S38L5]EYB15352.1 hypothetical protein M140_1078 [Bacteroides fragilis str. S38L3]
MEVTESLKINYHWHLFGHIRDYNNPVTAVTVTAVTGLLYSSAI